MVFKDVTVTNISELYSFVVNTKTDNGVVSAFKTGIENLLERIVIKYSLINVRPWELITLSSIGSIIRYEREPGYLTTRREGLISYTGIDKIDSISTEQLRDALTRNDESFDSDTITENIISKLPIGYDFFSVDLVLKGGQIMSVIGTNLNYIFMHGDNANQTIEETVSNNLSNALMDLILQKMDKVFETPDLTIGGWMWENNYLQYSNNKRSENRAWVQAIYTDSDIFIRFTTARDYFISEQCEKAHLITDKIQKWYIDFTVWVTAIEYAELLIRSNKIFRVIDHIVVQPDDIDEDTAGLDLKEVQREYVKFLIHNVYPERAKISGSVIPNLRLCENTFPCTVEIVVDKDFKSADYYMIGFPNGGYKSQLKKVLNSALSLITHVIYKK